RNPSEQVSFLREACGGDEELRMEVERLLKAQERAGSFMIERMGARSSGEGAFTLPMTPPPVVAGQRFGHYRIARLLGEGGMGTVYLAEQDEPIRRRVALKLIKLGMDTREVIARFESERQALAMMDHPNIAKVFDAGVSQDGRPYFVMEYVSGVPI